MKECVRFFNEFSEDIDAKRNRYEVDGKSLMGIIALGTDVPITFTIHSEEKTVKNRFASGLNRAFERVMK